MWWKWNQFTQYIRISLCHLYSIYVTSIQSINGTNDISMNDDKCFIHKYNAPFLPSKKNEDVSSRSEYESSKLIVRRNKNIILDYEINHRFLYGRYHCYFLLSITRNYHHIWIRSVNVLTHQIKKSIPIIRWAQLLLT